MAKTLKKIAYAGDLDKLRLHLPNSTEAQLTLAVKSAVAGGHYHIVRELLDRGAQACPVALIDAVRCNQEDIACILMKAGANVCVSSYSGLTPLMLAARNGAENIVLDLLQHSADVNQVDYKGRSALYYALNANHRKTAETLINAGANADYLGDMLGNMVIEGDVMKVRLLLRAGADPNKPSRVIPIISAAKHGNEEIVSALIEAGADVNKCTTPSGRTALYYAILGNHREMMTSLLKVGAISSSCGDLAMKAVQDCDLPVLEGMLRSGVHPNDPSNGMLIVSAAKTGNDEIVAALIRAGADVNMRNPGSRTALMWAAKLGTVETVRRLIEAGANVNDTLDKGHTALMWACAEGHEEVVQLLLDAGANTEQRNGANMTALGNASKTKFANYQRLQTMIVEAAANNTFRSVDETYFPIAKEFKLDKAGWNTLNQQLEESKAVMDGTVLGTLFADDIKINDADKFKRTLLMYTSYHGYAAIVAFLLKHGASVDAADINDMGSLMWATNGGHANVVNILLAWKASINATDNRMRTPLHHSIRGRDYPIANMLIGNGGYLLSSLQIDGALVWAAKHGNVLLLRELIRVGANVKETDSTGGTALMWATSNGRTDCVQPLLNAGAMIEAQDKFLKKAMWYAIDCGHIEVLNLLMSSGASLQDVDRGNPALCVASRAGKIDIVRCIMKHNANPQWTSKDGTTALMYACRSRLMDIVKLLLDYGVDVNVSNQDGNTALFEATFADSFEIVNLLLKHGAYIEARNKEGLTPLLAGGDLGNCMAVRALLDGGADIGVVDKTGENLFDLATSNADKGLKVATALVEFDENRNKAVAEKQSKKGKKNGAEKRQRRGSDKQEKSVTEKRKKSGVRKRKRVRFESEEEEIQAQVKGQAKC